MSDLSFITAWGTRPPATRNIPQAHQGRYHYSQKSPTPTISHFSGNQSIFSSLTKETLFVSGNSFWGFSFNMQAANVISEKNSLLHQLLVVCQHQSEMDEKCKLFLRSPKWEVVDRARMCKWLKELAQCIAMMFHPGHSSMRATSFNFTPTHVIAAHGSRFPCYFVFIY